VYKELKTRRQGDAYARVADKRMMGSVMIFDAESIDDVRAIIYADEYYNVERTEYSLRRMLCSADD